MSWKPQTNWRVVSFRSEPGRTITQTREVKTYAEATTLRDAILPDWDSVEIRETGKPWNETRARKDAQSKALRERFGLNF